MKKTLITLLALLLGACAGSPAAEDSPALEQTALFAGGRYQLSYPQGWLSGLDRDLLTIATDTELLTAEAMPLEAGRIVRIALLPPDAVTSTAGPNATPYQTLEALVTALPAGGQFVPPEIVTIGGRSGARTLETSPTHARWLVVLAGQGGELFVVQAVAPLGEMAELEPVLLAVLESIRAAPQEE